MGFWTIPSSGTSNHRMSFKSGLLIEQVPVAYQAQGPSCAYVFHDPDHFRVEIAKPCNVH